MYLINNGKQKVSLSYLILFHRQLISTGTVNVIFTWKSWQPLLGGWIESQQSLSWCLAQCFEQCSRNEAVSHTAGINQPVLYPCLWGGKLLGFGSAHYLLGCGDLSAKVGKLKCNVAVPATSIITSEYYENLSLVLTSTFFSLK